MAAKSYWMAEQSLRQEIKAGFNKQISDGKLKMKRSQRKHLKPQRHL